MPEQSYYNQRLEKLGITEEINQVNLWFTSAEAVTDDKGIKSFPNVLKPVKIFREHPKGIEIIVYTLDRSQPSYDNVVTDDKGKDHGSKQKKQWSIIRLEKPAVKPDGKEMKYQMPKGQGSYPFFPPALVDKYDSKTKFDNLYITEGFFKAFKGSMHGMDIVGLPSITHLKNKETGGLHVDILKLINTCHVKRVIWLVDGDCLDMSSKAFTGKEKVDLYKRPASFYVSINTFKQLLDDFGDVDKYFMHIDSDGILQQQNFFRPADEKITRDQIKGLDDILMTFPDKINDIVTDAASVSKTGDWFLKFNINTGLSKVRDYFRLNNVNTFYLFQCERNAILKGKAFLFNGTEYMYNDEKGECDILIPGDAKKYFRVGDSYYKWISRLNAFKQKETYFKGRLKSTLTDDHGKKFLDHVPKYEDFVNMPEHINYQQTPNGCFNTYMPLDYEPDEDECTMDDCPTFINYMKHLFGESKVTFTHPVTKEKSEFQYYELGLDYIQLLYQRPIEKLPILCLVSKENNTGKSTFANILRMIFGGNVAIIGNQDLAGDFNAHWCSKLIAAIDETKIDKHAVVEKVKSLSTAKKITMNAKGRDHVELDCYIKFIFITNNEENFIYATEEDLRYWVIKVAVLKQENPTILDNIEEEIPAILSYLNKRKLVTEKMGRMWFHPSLLKTEALKRVIQYSRPTIEKEIIQHLKDMFLDFAVPEILMSRQDIHQTFFKGRHEANYIERVIKDHLKIDQFHVLDPTEKDLFGEAKKIYKTRRYTFPSWDVTPDKKEPVRTDITRNGRPFVFKRERFIKPEEEVEVDAEMKQLNELISNQTIPEIPATPKGDELPF